MRGLYAVVYHSRSRGERSSNVVHRGTPTLPPTPLSAASATRAVNHICNSVIYRLPGMIQISLVTEQKGGEIGRQA